MADTYESFIGPIDPGFVKSHLPKIRNTGMREDSTRRAD